MNDKMTPKGSSVQEVRPLAEGEKRPWRRPVLAFLGKLGDLVQGWGKTGPDDDQDPKGTAKQGVG